jgi:hypothetical protein
MNSNKIIALLLISAFCILISAILGFSDEMDGSLQVTIEAESTSLMPLLPLRLIASLQNVGSQNKEVLISEPAVYMEYAYSEAGPWKTYWPDGLGQPAPTPPSRRILMPGESLEWSIIMDVNSLSTPKGRFAEPVLKADESSVFVRAKILNIAARPICVNIHMPSSGKDIAALDRLKSNKNCIGLLSEYSIYRKTTESDAACRAFVAEFSDSTYGAYARLAMALADLKEGNPSFSEHNFFNVIEDIGQNGPKALRALSWLYGAKAAGINTIQGQGYLQRAASEDSDPFVRSELRKLQGRSSYRK